MTERSREAGGSNVLIRLAALVGLTFWFIPLLAAVAQAQAPSNLPAGVVSVEIDNQPIDAVDSAGDVKRDTGDFGTRRSRRSRRRYRGLRQWGRQRFGRSR